MLTEREEMIVGYLKRLAADWGSLDADLALIHAIGGICSGEAFKKPSPTIPAEEWVKTPSVG